MTPSMLDVILANKRMELETRKQSRPLSEVLRAVDRAKPPLDLVSVLQASGGGPALIAECKRASPSRGLLVDHLDPLHFAKIYAENGAAAISVLTDERYFHGSLEDLQLVASANLGLPLLCKDFFLEPYQIFEARAAGADAILLIVAALDIYQLGRMQDLVIQLGMSALVEVHDRQDIEKALSCQPKLIGINNRDLHNFSTRLETCLELREAVPQEIVLVAESGIKEPCDVRRISMAGIDAILVGEALITAEDMPAKVRSLAWIEQNIPG